MVKIADIIKKHSDLIIASEMDFEVKCARPVDEKYNLEHISFIQGSDKEARDMFINFVGNCLIISYDFMDSEMTDGVIAGTNFTILVAKHPKLSFARVIRSFFYGRAKRVIHPSAQVGQGVQIGAGTTIHANVVIYDGVKIGRNCKIKAGAVIGGEGFGHSQNEFGEWENIVHIGTVVIEDNVTIGSNACIDRGTMDDTIIRRGVKIDNGVHIAHNVIIDENTLIIANSMVAGSVRIGKNCWIAPMVAIRNGITIGDNVMVGLGAVVVKDIPSDTRVMGVPAKPF